MLAGSPAMKKTQAILLFVKLCGACVVGVIKLKRIWMDFKILCKVILLVCSIDKLDQLQVSKL